MTAQKFTPLKIERVSSGAVRILWQDGGESLLDSSKLRKNCPCATCRESHGKKAGDFKKPSALRIVSHTAQEETTLVRIRAVGNYALALEWQDGHSTGIYPFELLRKLSEE